MKIVLYSDLHAGQTTEFSRQIDCNGRVVDSRLLDAISILRLVRETVKEHKADAVVFLGDFFHDRYILEVAVMQIMREELGKSKVPSYFIQGNHDAYYDDPDAVTSLSALSGIKNVHVITEPCEIDGLVLLPYRKDPMKELRSLPVDTKQKNRYLFAHLTPCGAKVSGSELLSDIPVEESTPNGVLLGRFKRCFTGHIHKPQDIGLWRVVGSPLQINRGERNEDKYIYVLDTTTDKLTKIPTKGKVPRFMDIRVEKVDELQKYTETVAGNYVTAVVHPTIRSLHSKQLDALVEKSAGWSESYIPAEKGGDETETPLQRQDFPDLMRHYVELNPPDKLDLSKLMDEGKKLIDGLTVQYCAGHSIHLNYMKLTNFMAKREFSLRFHKGKITQIAGDNGAGKSAIIESVYWAFTGATIRKMRAARVVRSGSKGCSVTVGFHLEGSKYVLTRRRKGGSSSEIVLHKDGKRLKFRGSADKKQEQLESYLGISSPLLQHTSFIMVKSRTFADLSNNDKYRLLLDSVIGVGALDEAAQRARKAVREHQSDAAVAETRVRELEQQFKDVQKLKKSHEKDRNKALESYEKKRRAYALYKRDKENYKFRLEGKERDLAEAVSYRADTLLMLGNIDREIEKVRGEIGELETYVASKKCPACNSLLKASPNRRVWQERFDKLTRRLKKCERIRRKRQARYDESMQADKKAQLAVRTLRASLEELKPLSVPEKPKFKDYNRFVKLSNKILRKTRVQKAIIRNRQRKLPYLSYWADAFGNSGMKNLVVRSLVSILDTFVSSTVKSLSGGKVSAGVELTDKGEIEITTSTDSGGQTYDEASSGQQARVDIALMLALESLARNYNITSLDAHFIDEKYSYLDRKGRVTLMETIRGLAQESKSAYAIVDHNPIVRSYVDQIVQAEGTGRK